VKRQKMKYSETIDGSKIRGWCSSHREFKKKMGFFPSYGENMNAWNDCMRDMFTNGEYKSLTKFDINDGDSFKLIVINSAMLEIKDPKTYDAFIDGCNFVNEEKPQFELELK
jgi:hypothetical protein